MEQVNCKHTRALQSGVPTNGVTVPHVKCVYLTTQHITYSSSTVLEIMPASVLPILTKHLGKQKVCVKYNHGPLECDTLSGTWLTAFLKDLLPQSLGW